MCKRMLFKMQVLQLMQRVLPSGVWDATSDTKALWSGEAYLHGTSQSQRLSRLSLVYSIELEFQIKGVKHSCKESLLFKGPVNHFPSKCRAYIVPR